MEKLIAWNFRGLVREIIIKKRLTSTNKNFKSFLIYRLFLKRLKITQISEASEVYPDFNFNFDESIQFIWKLKFAFKVWSFLIKN